ncbi:MAG: single-stranded-DNA-specific exonuclease RecJ [Candidatus Sericytochromatia bacterium]|nr:single-stranded-DNA-specific exonuclease RecJ [Candidatus Sericytochromatia bacterium]
MPAHPRLYWQTRATSNASSEALRQALGLPPLLATVLAARGWQPGAAVDAFLAEAEEAEPDYTALPGMALAVARLREAILAEESITVCGDYDIDGITATALLLQALRQHGARVDYHLPQRNTDGYGLTTAALDALAAAGSQVLVTVDSGTTALEELAHARALGLAVIVTDHHLPGPRLPPAVAIVNPHLADAPGVLAPLSGVGLAYALARALDAAHPVDGADARDLQDLVVLGTLSDQAPLSQENRRLVKLGLERIRRAPRPGIAALARVAKCNLKQRYIAEQLSQRVIPRLNAAGRMAHPRLALELLLNEDEASSSEMAQHLERLNHERRTLSLVIESEVQALISLNELPRGPAVVLHNAHWHHGVLGIVASRVAGRENRPTLLLAPENGGTWRGSGRSPAHFDLHAALSRVQQHVVRFGGHGQAVGVSVREADMAAFVTALQAEVQAMMGDAAYAPKVWKVDAEVPLGWLSYETVAELDRLEPTGPENPAPLFVARHLRVVRQERRGPENEHLWLELADDTGTLPAIAFGRGGQYPLETPHLDAVFVPLAERWQGRNRLTLKILDLCPSPNQAG